MTPLHLALKGDWLMGVVTEGHEEVAKVLREAGAIEQSEGSEGGDGVSESSQSGEGEDYETQSDGADAARGMERECVRERERERESEADRSFDTRTGIREGGDRTGGTEV